MPQAIPVVVGWLGTIGGAVSFGVATGIGAVMVGGAVVGAAIGGLTAAVTGGDIGKGMLYGGIGGAVLGGLGAYAAPGALATTTGHTGVAAGTAMGGSGGAGFGGVGATGVGATPAYTAGGGAGGLLAGGEGLSTGAGMLGSAVLDIGGGALQGIDQSKEAEKAREFQEQQANEQRALQEKLNAMNNETQIQAAEISSGPAYARIAEDRRQFDVSLNEQRGARKRAAGAAAGVTASRKAYKANTRGLDEASTEIEAERTGMMQGEIEKQRDPMMKPMTDEETSEVMRA